MSYQVLARKWRPGRFSDVIGQEHVVRTLSNAVSSGRVGHAYLFSGPRGVGKTTVARILAKCLNCKDGPVAEPCNSCEFCGAITTGHSMDVLEIDGASSTGVENVRELRESIRYVPQGRYRIYIIDEVHMLSTGAFNALLKTLEEPPPHAVFIFATTEPSKVPLTVHSRCQRFDFRRIPLKKIHEQLSEIAKKENISIEDSALYLIAKEAQGSLRDAQGLLEQVRAFSGESVKAADAVEALGLMDRTIVLELTEALLKKDIERCLNIVEKMNDFGYDFKKVAAEILSQIRDLAVLRVTGNGSLLDLPESEVERLTALSKDAGIEKIEMLFGVFSRGYEDVGRASAPRFSFEMTLLKGSHLDELVAVSELMERLEGFSAPKADRPPAPVERTPRTNAVNVSPDMEGFLSMVKERDERLFRAIASSTAALDASTLEIAANAENAGVLIVKKELLKELAGEWFKRKIAVELKKTEVKSTDSLSKDPLVKEALSTFGARVVEERRRKDG